MAEAGDGGDFKDMGLLLLVKWPNRGPVKQGMQVLRTNAE